MTPTRTMLNGILFNQLLGRASSTMTDTPFFDFDAAKEAMARIRRCDLKGISTAELVDWLTPVFCGLRLRTPRFAPGLRLFRGCIGEKPTRVEQLQHPPPALVAKPGRVNDVGESVFYAASMREIPFFELEPFAGDTFTISHWQTTAKLLVNNIGYTQAVFGALRSQREASEAAKWVLADMTEGERVVVGFLSEEFCRRIPRGEEDQYKITRAISRKMFDSDMFDGLLYPTVAMRAHGDNFAIKPQFVREGLEFVKAEFLRIDAVEDFSFRVKVLDTAVDTDEVGVLKWRGRGDVWVLKNKGDALTLTAEDGKWVARDEEGNIVEPS